MSISKLRPCVHVALVLVALSIPIAAGAADAVSGGLSCIRIKDSGRSGAGAVVDAREGCEIKGGATFACTSATASLTDETAESGKPLVFDRLCYELTCGSSDDGERGAADDALGTHVFHTAESSLVCTPATIVVPGSTDGAGGAHGSRGEASGGSGAHVDATSCGNFNGDATLSASDALGILRSAIGSSTCLICICDVDNTATITATDALKLLKFAVGQAVTLTCQPDGNPISWDGGGDGFSWTNADNWSLNRIPNACDDVTIVTVATVTHASGDNGAKTITANSDLDLTGGSLSLRGAVDVTGLFRLRGATLKNADIVLPATAAPLVLTNTGGTLDGVSVATDLDLTQTSAYAYIQNGLTFGGTAEIGPNAGIYFQGTGEQNFDGTGTVHFGTTFGQVYNYGNTLHIGPDITIHGGNGAVTGNQADSHLTNDGRIDSDGGGTITVGTTAASWTNTGTLGAHSGGILTLQGPWSNTGTLELDSTSTINLGGVFASIDVGTISRAGGTINLTGQMTNAATTFTLDSAKGDWRLLGGTVSGGTIASAEGAKLLYTNSGGTLDDVTSAGDMDLTQTSSFTYIQNGLTLNGTAEIGQNAGLFFQGTGEQTFDGTGTVHFGTTFGQVYNYSNTLHIGSGIQINGIGGQVGGNQGDSHMTIDGTIDSNGGGTITVGTTGSWTNTGTIGAHTGSILTLQGPWTNTGTFALDGTSTLNLGGTFTTTDVGTISRTGGTINLTGVLTNPSTLTLNAATGDWRVLGGTIKGGTIDFADSAKLIFTSSGGNLDDVTIVADMDITQPSAYAYIQNGLTLNATAELGSNSGLFFQGTGEQTFDGTGTVHFASTYSNVYNYGNTLHIGPDILIHGGGGNVGGNQTDSRLTNDGTIDSDGGGGSQITVGTTASWTNNGTMGAHNGSVLTIQGPWTNAGTIALDGTSTVNLAGTFTPADIGTISRTGGTINLTGTLTNSTLTLNATTGDWRFVGGTIKGGTIDSADGAKLVYTSSGGNLDGVTSATDMDLSASSSYAYIQNGLTLNGTAECGSNSGLFFQGTGEQQFAGTATVHFGTAFCNVYNYSNTLHIASSILIHGMGGNVGGNQSDSHMTNDGTIAADGGGTITVGTTGSWTNNGTLRATGASSILQTNGPWTNDGTVEMGAGGTFNASTGFTQNGGGELKVDIKGTAASDFGKATVTGAANLGGTLTIVLQNGFVPNIGDTFQIMTFGTTSGSFATTNGITIGGGKKFNVNVGATSITLEVVAG